MLKSNWKMKLIVMLLIFTLTFSNFALVGKTFAASIFSDDKGDTGSANVEFDASFIVEQNEDYTELQEPNEESDAQNAVVQDDLKNQETNSLNETNNTAIVNETEVTEETDSSNVIDNSVNNLSQTEEQASDEETRTTEQLSGNEEEVKDLIADINDSNLKIKLKVKVSNIGYLKNAKIILGNGEELNFGIDSNNFENNMVQKFENNSVELVQMNANSEAEIIFPIYYLNNQYMELNNVSKSNVIKFEGTYVDDDKEISVSKKVNLSLAWKDNREVKVSSEVTKYVNFSVNGENGVILQTLVKADNSTESNKLPVDNLALDIQVPVVNGVKPETVKVVASSLIATSGKDISNLEFNSDNWSYDSENNKLSINVKNSPELVSIQNEDDVLIDETAEKVEAYYVGSGVDEFLVTYVYKGVSLENTEITSNITSTYNMYGGTSLTSKEEKTYTLTQEIGDIVTFSTETSTKSISKAYTYLNYNNPDDKYEIEIDNKLIFNISYKDIVNGLYYEDSTNYYITNTGESIAQNDLYYKNLKVSKNNFNEILGENGFINIFDNNGNLLATINNTTEATEDENYEVNLSNSDIRWIKIETSNPIAEGNLNITTIRAYKDVGFDKVTYRNFDKININSIARARYTDVNDLVDCGTATTEVKLENTSSNAVLNIGQESLSTLATNNNVEIKIEFNNDKVTSDVYGNSEFIIKMPEYIDSLEITDYSIVYGEGLEISNVELYEQDGRIFAKINVTGVQNHLSSGIVSNGTNIVLNANIKVNLYAPAMETNFELNYTNSEATSYASEKDGLGYNTALVKYSAPSGVVSVNSISEYNENGDTVSSVKQGTVIGDLDIYSKSRTATMELIIMNNEANIVSNIAILGRTMFVGNKDILTNEDLGTTINAPMISGISSDTNNGADFTIYYSTNENATKDLNDAANGWTTQVTDWSTIKSYLIVPNDPNYVLNVAQKLRFVYEFTIPENLPHNEDVYGTFGTYYTNNTDVATVDEFSVADLVGLSTGVGPELSIESTVDSNTINEFEEFKMTTVVKNTGEVAAKNVVVTVPIPEFTTYIDSLVDNENVVTEANKENSNNITYTLDELEVGGEFTIVTTFEVQEIYTDNIPPESLHDPNYVPEEIQEHKIEVYSTVTADDFGTTLKSSEIEITVTDAKMRIQIIDVVEADRGTLKVGDQVILNIVVSNLTKEDFTNVELSAYIDEALNVQKLETYDEENNLLNVGSFDETTRTYSWSIDKLAAGDSQTFVIYLEAGSLAGTELSRNAEFKVKGIAEGIEEYESEAFNMKLGRSSILVKQTTNTTNSYVKEGETIEYVFSITNEGPVIAKSVTLTDYIPEGLIVNEIRYEVNGQLVKQSMSEAEEATVTISVEAGETKDVTVVAVAQNLNGVQELSVTNRGSITVEGETIEANSITHIIESTGAGTTIGESSSGDASSSTSSDSDLLKTYNIEGVAWVDSNRDGARGEQEELLKGVNATLVNSDTGVIMQTAVTNSEGAYKFTGVQNGNYIIIFDYDTVLYTVTTYHKENVASNINSDVISSKIEQDGKLRNGAVTDVITINEGSISNIDIGLMEAMKFDLSLSMGVSQITVQNTQGTKTKSYNLDTYTKTEISQRFIAGSEIYIEYTLTVKNEGEVSGYASSIVDYIPEGMNFNSSLNSNWYTGNDGNLYTTALENTEIAPGESKTLTLILSKTMTNENTGTVSNTAEIASDYNIYGISDIDSTPGNNNQNEDDFARVDNILTVGTGGVWIYISVTVTTALLVGTAVFIIILKRKNKVIKGGV